MEAKVNDIYVEHEGKLKKATATLRTTAKGGYTVYFMVKYGDASDLKEIIDITWDYDLEDVVKRFVQKAVKLGLREFKIVDGIGTIYRVEVDLEEA